MLTAQRSRPIVLILNASFNSFEKSSSNVYSLINEENQTLNFLTIAVWKLVFIMQEIASELMFNSSL